MLAKKLETTLDTLNVKPSISRLIEKITKTAIDTFKKSKLKPVRESWQFNTQLPDEFESEVEAVSERSTTQKIVIKSEQEVKN